MYKFPLSQLLILFALAQSTMLVAQLNSESETESVSASMAEDIKTRNPEQNAAWRQGDSKFSARPRDMWELGIGAGSFFVSGDVPGQLPGGLALNLSARKAINYTFSIRGELSFGTIKGLDYRLMGQGTGAREYPSVAALYTGVMPRAYRARYYGADVQGIMNIGNLLFHRASNKWNFYTILGIGLYTHDTRMNFLDDNGNAYDFSGLPTDATSLSERSERRTAIKDILNSEYETRGSIKSTGLRLNDNMNILGHLMAGVGISRRINRRVNVALEYNVRFSDNDHIDGITWRSPTALTNNKDIMHFTTVRVGINLGSFNQKTEPLYWANPLDAVFNDVAELKRRPVFDLTDSDGDGVIDLLDLEPNTPEGAIVDVKGRTLDSDGDGVPDYLDKEPFSPPGFEVDTDGRALVPKYMTEEQVRTLVNEVVNNKLESVKTEWFLPTIHFDLDKYFIKPEYYTQLHQIAQVMKLHPAIKVTVVGHTDVRGSKEYNEMLSYNRSNAAIQYMVDRYKIPRDRFILQFNGDSDNLVEGLPARANLSADKEMQQYLNRRVEFRVAAKVDKEMEKPDGPEAGKNTPTPGRAGTKYSGSRNVGY